MKEEAEEAEEEESGGRSARCGVSLTGGLAPNPDLTWIRLSDSRHFGETRGFDAQEEKHRGSAELQRALLDGLSAGESGSGTRLDAPDRLLAGVDASLSAVLRHQPSRTGPGRAVPARPPLLQQGSTGHLLTSPPRVWDHVCGLLRRIDVARHMDFTLFRPRPLRAGSR